MAYTETFSIVVDGEEVGSADVITRPTGDLIDRIGNERVRASRSGTPYNLVNYEITQLVKSGSVRDEDGRELQLPKDVGKMPAGARRVLYDRVTEIVNPLLPNLGGAS